jgi:OOP family OmpA-OmpF porin
MQFRLKNSNRTGHLNLAMVYSATRINNMHLPIQITFILEILMKLIRPLIASALLSVSACAMAADTGWYIAGDIGQAKQEDGKDEIDGALVGLGATGINSSFDETDNSFSLLAGYQFNRNFALEGGYIDLGKAKYTSTSSLGNVDASAEVTAWKLSAVGIMPINDAFSVLGKLHVLRSDVKVEASGPAGVASASDNSFDFGLGLGVEYKITSNLAVRANWDQYIKVGDSSTTGESDIRVLSAGLKYSF